MGFRLKHFGWSFWLNEFSMVYLALEVGSTVSYSGLSCNPTRN